MSATNFSDNPFVTKLPPAEVADNRLDVVLEMCRDRKVLHLGCANERMLASKLKAGTLTHLMLQNMAREVWGLDISAEGISLLEENGIDRLICGDVETIDSLDALKGQTFDVILASEILEHLDNPGLFLEGIKKVFAADTIMILTVPNALGISTFGPVFRGHEIGHPDHTLLFSFRTLSKLLARHSFQVKKVMTYTHMDCRASLLMRMFGKIKMRVTKPRGVEESGECGEGADDICGQSSVWGSVKSNLKEIGSVLVRRVLCWINPFLADGLIFVVECKRDQSILV